MARSPSSSSSNKYALPTIGGIFGRSDHDQFLISHQERQFDTFFPATLHEKMRKLYETGIDALAAILCERRNSHGSIRLWTPENFCRESLARLKIKLEGPIEFVSYRNLDDFRELTSEDIVLYLHFNGYDSASVKNIEAIKRKSGATVIEDFVQAPLDISRFSGDFALNSLRKFSSVDVAVAYLQAGRQTSFDETRYRVLRKQAELVRSQFLANPTQDLEQRFLKLGRESDAALVVPAISSAHPEEIERAMAFDFKTALSLRRCNYVRLAENIRAEIPEIRILPGDYMYLMIATEHRDRFRADLFAERIFPVIHWADSGSVEVRSLLSLHVDQRYSSADMDRVSAAMQMTGNRLRRDVA